MDTTKIEDSKNDFIKWLEYYFPNYKISENKKPKAQKSHCKPTLKSL